MKPATRGGGFLFRTGIYLVTPRLRGLLAFNPAVAAGAMVIVKALVLVEGNCGLGDGEVA